MDDLPAPLSATCRTTCNAFRRRSATTLLPAIVKNVPLEKQCQSVQRCNTVVGWQRRNIKRRANEGKHRIEEPQAI